MKTLRSLTLGAGLGFLALAVVVQGFLPWLTPASRDRSVTRAVRTELGEIKWVWYEAADYTPLEARGRAVYVREGCWYCHSQYVRPVAGEDFRWGPVSEAGEYHFDQPHLLGTRRVGPDLTRIGLRLADGWHYAHHWDPRMVVPDSNMPAFRWLFHQLRLPVREAGGEAVLGDHPELARFFTMAPTPLVPLYPNQAGLAFADPGRVDDRIPGTPVLDLRHFKDARPRLTTVTLVVPSRDLVALVAYLQKLGTSRGLWRDAFEPQAVAVGALYAPATARMVERGRAVYRQRCLGCHGLKGDGSGPAATFLSPRPRDFTAPAFRFRSTPSGALPTDGDLFRTITRGVRWTAMPAWHELRDTDRLAVIQLIKTFAPDAWREPAETPLVVPEPPPATPELLARGRTLFDTAKCWECHGREGKGDGPSAPDLRTDDGFPIRPTDLTRGQLKGGVHVPDVFRALSTGLTGTPMPSYAESLAEDERWALAYFVLSLSAFTDPLTGETLRLTAGARAALDEPGIGDEPHAAYDPASDPAARPDRRAARPERYRYRFGLQGGPKE